MMAFVKLDNGVPSEKEFAEGKIVQTLVKGTSQASRPSPEDKVKMNGVAERIHSGSVGPNNVPCGSEKLQYQRPVHWERFLPKRSLKVLLVENDDSTRHVVSALLKNCSYEVIAVENGLLAWRILANMSNHVDLVLTEVVMPVLSGVGLLCKMMSHKTFKTIPVIMMSSHDSMGLVFRCLSKGAVDFLVKPIRKNELKNLWQHVWRRCLSSSGSGSESGTQARTTGRSKSIRESDNYTGSSDEHDNGSNGASIRDGSDNGSGTQSSWTQRVAEKESSQPVSPHPESANTPDSTCAQVIHTKTEAFTVLRVKETENNQFQEQAEELGKEKDVYGNMDSNCGRQDEMGPTSHIQNQVSEQKSNLIKKEQRKDGGEKGCAKGKNQTVDLTCSFANCSNNPQLNNQADEAPKDCCNLMQLQNSATCDLELTLKSSKGSDDVLTSVHDERNILIRSDLSAFSKYNNGSTSQAPTGIVGSCSPPDNISIAKRTAMMNNSNDTRPYHQSNGSCNNNGGTSTMRHVSKPEAVNDKSLEPSSAFKKHQQPVSKNGHVSVAKQKTVPPVQADDVADQVGPLDQQFQVQHHHHHYHHHHHHVHRQSELDQGNDTLPKNISKPASSQCGSSDMIGDSDFNGNAENKHVNGGGSGSKHGSNEQNGSNKGLDGANMESNNGGMGNSGGEGGSKHGSNQQNGSSKGLTGVNMGSNNGGTGNSGGADENPMAHREAALNKLHQKRKERCFEKKVHKQSRKKAADQRPHVKGQSARHLASDNGVGSFRQDSVANEDDSGNDSLQ